MKKDKDIKEEKDIAQDTQAENASNMNEGEGKTAEAQEEKGEEKTIEQQLQEANEKIAELKDQYLRKAAEFENYRKRTLKEKSELILNGAESTVKAMTAKQ